MMKNKGQVSMEFMIVVGFVTFIVLTMLVISQFYQNEVASNVEKNQVDNLARKIIESSESVYYLGAPSKTTIVANMPSNIDSVDVFDNEIVFKVKVPGGVSDISYTSNVNLSGSLSSSPGVKRISIEAVCGDFAGCYAQISG